MSRTHGSWTSHLQKKYTSTTNRSCTVSIYTEGPLFEINTVENSLRNDSSSKQHYIPQSLFFDKAFGQRLLICNNLH